MWSTRGKSLFPSSYYIQNMSYEHNHKMCLWILRKLCVASKRWSDLTTKAMKWSLSLPKRSGDVLIMTEKARNSYHAVPRVLDQSMIDASRMREKLGLPDELISYRPSASNEEKFCIDYLSNHRININTRQVFWNEKQNHLPITINSDIRTLFFILVRIKTVLKNFIIQYIFGKISK